MFSKLQNYLCKSLSTRTQVDQMTLQQGARETAGAQ